MDPTHARDHETIEALQVEVERHRRANLLRAVLDGHDVLDEAVTAAINAEGFDRVPWLVAERFLAENKRLRKALYTAIVSPEDDPDALGVALDHTSRASLSASREAGES
jgi:hypothetical protein